jgi:3-methyl-2-oxobutanoate hydroxymethyltransferase
MSDERKQRPRVTVPKLRTMKEHGQRITMLTAYDATFARMLDEADIDVLLVGDSLGMVVQGLDSTLPVTVDEIIYHCRAVARGARRALVVGDMPFMSYQVSAEDALRNAGRFLAEGGAHAVKLEGGAAVAHTIRRVVDAGIPVMAHVGLTPQSVHAMGGFRVQGKTEEAAERILHDARVVEDAGAFALVLEGIPSDHAERITAELTIPTIGIGAGPSCDGQVLVSYDLLGLTPNLRPKFVKRYAEMFEDGVEAARRYADEVRAGAFPDAQHAFGSVVRSVVGSVVGSAVSEVQTAQGAQPAARAQRKRAPKRARAGNGTAEVVPLRPVYGPIDS